MNLEAHIKAELWTAIESSYQAGNYTHSVRDAMAVITNKLRDKSGLDVDGRDLVNQALGFGKNNEPKVKLNRFQTETERNIQLGFREVLAGMYSLVRNPRSHETVNDTKQTADALLLFINYLLDFLIESKSAFTIQDFIGRVTDRFFSPKPEYVQGLVDKIPRGKRYDTLIHLYHEKNWGSSDNFRLVLRSLLKGMPEKDVADFLLVVSDELEKVSETSQVSLIIKVLPTKLWPKLTKISRLRAEHMLVSTLDDSWYIPARDETNNSPSTWLTSIVDYFESRGDLMSAIYKLLDCENMNCQNYVANYYMQALPKMFADPWDIDWCAEKIFRSIEGGNDFMKSSLHDKFRMYSTEWQSIFVKYMPDLNDKLVAQEEDEIPF